MIRVLPRRRLDLDVEWDRPGGQTLRLRLVLIWTRPERAYTVLVTNVPRSILTARHVAELYRLRWQIELVFKKWKSYANLHAFTSANPAIVEGQPARFILTSEEDDRRAATKPVCHDAFSARARRVGKPRAEIYVAVLSSCSSTHDPLGRRGPLQ